MRNNMRIFLPNEVVPSWLEKQRPQEGFEKQAVLADIKFTSVVLVLNVGGCYSVINLLPKRNVMSINNGRHITIEGQSPNGGSGGVMFYGSLFTFLGI